MTNLLNSYITNQPIKKPLNHEGMPSFTFDTEGKIKPLNAKGKLLPSRIIGSPIEYAKDLRKDIVSIGKAAKGKANDHELGRINDLAMKLGSLGLATYLFVKNPFKLSKTMEFVGLGTFFGSMALWPKLAIQLPLRQRTGVDIHQKYIDSQDRKKMLHQDPQYDLTDLYSREDLDKMGKKLGVAENLPDRDKFIKQRAKKTAIQGNTLWMMTAGFASPIMSALACNALEKPINNLLETGAMAKAESALHVADQSLIARAKEKLASRAFGKFLEKNKDKAMDSSMITDIAKRFSKLLNDKKLEQTVVEELTTLGQTTRFDGNFVKNALATLVPDMDSLPEAVKTSLNEAIDAQSIDRIARILSGAKEPSRIKGQKLAKQIAQTLTEQQAKVNAPTVASVKDKLTTLYTEVSSFAKGKNLINRFINSRVGEQPGSYVANQWGRVSNNLLKSLKLNGKQLKQVAAGDMEIVEQKLKELAQNPQAYDKFVKKLVTQIDDYSTVTGSERFVKTVAVQMGKVCAPIKKTLEEHGFGKLASAFTSKAGGEFKAEDIAKMASGTFEAERLAHMRTRVSGAKSSFYRLLQTVDLLKQIDTDAFAERLTANMRNEKLPNLTANLPKLKAACKEVLMSGTTTDYIEKLKSAGFDLSIEEFRAVMRTLFVDKADDTIGASLTRTMGQAKSESLLSGFNAYRDEMKKKVVNWCNGMTSDLSRRTIGEGAGTMNAIERNDLVGKPIKGMIQDVAKQTYNSRKWLKIFGGAMIALTGITLVAGLFIGRKDKVEKQIEEESKING